MNTDQSPPRLFHQFFRWFCHPELMASIEGDLFELYQERLRRSGKRKADVKFIIDVLLLFRPGIIKSFEGYKKLNNYGMLKSYFKIGWRNLLRNKGYSFINIGGLSIGMAVAILIGLWVHDELSYNTYHKNYNSIAKVYRHNTFTDYIGTNVFSLTGLGSLLQTEYGSQFKHVVMVKGSKDNRVIEFGQNRFTERGFLMQSSGPEMLSLDMIHGNHQGMKDKNAIMLSETLANKLFPNKNPLDQIVKMDAKWDVKVGGVYKDLPQNTEFAGAAYLAPLELVYGEEYMNIWNNYNVFIYVQLQPERSFDQVEGVIKDIMLPHVDEKTAETDPRLFLIPMKDWHLDAEFENGVRITSSKKQSVWYFTIIGCFVLLLACINFMNLSTARSERRAKEVGIRKSIGSIRGQLISQFFTESLLVAMLSFISAIVLVQLLLPTFNSIADKQMQLPWNNWQFWLLGVGFTFVTGLLAGSYPALYLSSFNPVRVLKGSLKTGRFALMPRRVLVVIQFAVSIILIAGTGIVYEQMQYGKDRPVGYTREGLISVRLGAPENRGDLDVLRTQFLQTGMVEEIGEANYQVTSTLGWNDGFTWKDRNEDISNLNFNTIFVTHGYGKTVGWDVVRGRDFSREYATDFDGVVINESAANNLGLEDPIGETLIWNVNGERYEYTILGIVKDMVKGSPFDATDPSMIFLWMRPLEFLYIRINPNVSMHEAIPKIEKAFKQLMPNLPFDYTFADQDYSAKFGSEERTSALVAMFSALAIGISCLGLLGLASFTTEQRTKEIGIRKVMGATVPHIWKMLSKEFVLLVIIACAIALPLAYLFMNGWLENYEYRTNINWLIFLISGGIALFITIVTVSFHAIKAAVANPVNSLRSE